MPTPFQSAYVAAKHALEGYSECLAMETAAQGIQVMLVEPGDHQGGSSRYRASAGSISPLYQDSFARARDVVLRDEAKGGSPEAFARKLARVMGKKRLPLRLKVTTLKENTAIILHDVLPGRWFLKSLRDYYKV
jgi:NAD(P)-dependent dehydrogenase (short-subunit alcohol dehydrogenase family)